MKLNTETNLTLVIDFLRRHAHISIDEASAILRVERSVARRFLNKLTKAGVLVKRRNLLNAKTYL